MVAEHIILKPEDHYKLTAKDFGMDGLYAIESVGPYVKHQAVGPLIMVHDSVLFAGMGIGHHPHRGNERLFYVESGEFDHDDALNHVQGHAGQHDMARFTEGQQGMIHKEWNNGSEDNEIFILVAATKPVPKDMDFDILRSEDMAIKQEASGVTTRFMVGGGTDFDVYSDIHTFTDSIFEEGSKLDWQINESEGGLLSVREGAVDVEGSSLETKYTYLIPPTKAAQSVKISAKNNARVIRTTFGPGFGLIT